jgi:branched-chain amino acid transport system ATP-binding protein
VLELAQVHAAYGLSRVLHGVSLTARAGEVVSLLGRNGAGKSSTLKSIIGLIDVTAGDIRLDGRALRGLATHEISRLGVGWVPEDRRIFSDLTVEENLRVGERSGGVWDTARVYALFPKLGEQIAALKREGLTILLSEQNLRFAARLADRAYVIEKGEIRWEGPIAQLMADEAIRRAYLSV